MLTTLMKGILTDRSQVLSRPEGVRADMSFYGLSVPSLTGKELIGFDRFKGKKIVVINVASRCGFTPQYADWQQFHEEYGDRIVVLGCPSNNFLWQEPGNAGQIAEFCQVNYGVTFQLLAKMDVTGPDQHPLYQWLSRPDQNGWNDQEPSWNFCKYLIDEAGNLTHFFGPKIKPGHPAFRQAAGID